MTTPQKVRVADAHDQHPDWTKTEIAKHVGVTTSYVSWVAVQLGLKFPDGRSRRWKDFQEVNSLGRAARAAGLSLADIKRIGASKVDAIEREVMR